MMLNEIMVKPFAVKTNGNNGFNHDILSAEVFGDVRFGYLNEFRLYYSYFNAIPNWKEDRGFDCIKAQKWFGEQYRETIAHAHYSLTYKTRRSHSRKVSPLLWHHLPRWRTTTRSNAVFYPFPRELYQVAAPASLTANIN